MGNAEKARTTTLPRVIYALGIANIGLANAKVICKEFRYDVEKMLGATEEELNEIPGVGGVIAKAFVDYFASEKHVRQFRDLLEELVIPKETAEETKQICRGEFRDYRQCGAFRQPGRGEGID